MKQIKQFLLSVKWSGTIVGACLVALMVNGIITASPATSTHKAPYLGVVRSSLVGNDLIQADGKVVQPLVDFLKLFKIEHQGTVESINKAMQMHFIRKPGSERWDLVDSPEDQKLRAQAFNLLKSMELVDAIPPTTVHADYFLLFGATLARIEKRFADFLEQYQRGTLTCKNIVLLGGIRYLRPTELDSIKQNSTFDAFLKDQKKTEATLTEADLWRFVWQTKATDALKAQFQESKDNLFFVNSTNITHGTNQRATTHTTLETWLEDFKPVPGKCHANVEKPYGVRMEKNLRHVLEKYSRAHESTQHFSITWNSPAADDNLLLAVYKDELARAFHQEYDLKKYLGMLSNEARSTKSEKK
jgi:hypothetical protein